MSFFNLTGKNYKIIRYMDLAKFLSLIEDSSIFFCRADVLKNTDCNEGSFSKNDFEQLYLLYKEQRPERLSDTFSEYFLREELKKLIDEYNNRFLKIIAISCWNQFSEEEQSNAMWKIYSGQQFGIAIITTVEKLKSSLQAKQCNQDQVFLLNKINYINNKRESCVGDPKDYNYLLFYLINNCNLNELNSLGTLLNSKQNSFNIKETNILTPIVFTKRNEFKYEQELRIIKSIKHDADSFLNNGENCLIDLNILIEEILIAPDSPNWFIMLIKKYCEKNGINPNLVKQSDLNTNMIHF